MQVARNAWRIYLGGFVWRFVFLMQVGVVYCGCDRVVAVSIIDCNLCGEKERSARRKKKKNKEEKKMGQLRWGHI